MPFPFQAPQITMDTLDRIVLMARGAFPDALRVGQRVVSMGEQHFYDVREKVESVVPGIEQRIAMQYAISLLCTQQVCIT